MADPAGPGMRLVATVLASPEPRRLARFYQRLLGWPLITDEATWATLRPGRGGAGLSFHLDDGYVRPAWPTAADEQQIMMHLDIGVPDLSLAVQAAEEAGATVADHQPQPHVRVMLDPDGHPFCLFELGEA